MIMKSNLVSVCDFGAKGNGFDDDYIAFQRAFDSGAKEISVPFGTYNISTSLKVGSDIKIKADRCAKIKFCPEKRCERNDFLLSNKNVSTGDMNICIEGGIWDGNNTSEYTAKPDILDTLGYSGTVLNFINVKKLKLKNIVVANSTTYYIRMSKIEDFVIEDIDFISDEYGHNQDGLHFGGEVRKGKVKNIRALSFGQTNDDMIALNADDALNRVENLDLVNGTIEDITFENIYAENCFTVVRMLSIDSAIRNIKFKNIYAGYRNYAINMDGARYCKIPLFDDKDRPFGVGNVENVRFENFSCYPVYEPISSSHAGRHDPRYAICVESKCKKLEIQGFKRFGASSGDGSLSLHMKNVTDTKVLADGKEFALINKSDELSLEDCNNIIIDDTSFGG